LRESSIALAMGSGYLDLIMDDQFKLELILKYLECTATKYWVEWCLKYLDVVTLFQGGNVLE
ncbi:hypothetical protein, partial [Serratia marcescens]|uniref:hypothetical protein n=1 Tax=Serratia marcescens TaxID=615 RepID=UPI0013D992E5